MSGRAAAGLGQAPPQGARHTRLMRHGDSDAAPAVYPIDVAAPSAADAGKEEDDEIVGSLMRPKSLLLSK